MTKIASPEEHYRKITHAYVTAPINAFYAPELRLSEGKAEVSFDVDPKMHHAAHAAHGSIYFKALDDAAFFAANSIVDDVFVLTVSFTTYFLRPIRSGRITAKGRLVHRTGRLFFAEATLVDQDGNEIGRGNGTFMRSNIKLDPTIGYK